MDSRVVSHFKVLEKLGGGGMGVVYLAEDLELDRIVALKFLPTHLTQDPEANERFVHEARAASALNHPNVCTIHEIGRTEDGQQFIAMAHYPGRTLKSVIADGPVAADLAVRIAHQIASGLARAHDHGVVHRDIKPGNIIITEDERAVILDFGLAKLAGAADLTKTGSTVGTMPYMSPEQLRGEHVDGRTDVWSLGAVLYELVTGKKPFEAEYEQAIMYSILNTEPEPVEQCCPDVSSELGQVVSRALDKNLDTRFRTAAEMADALAALAEAPAIAPADTARMLRATILRPRVVFPVVAVLILGILMASLLVRHEKKVRWAREEALPRIEQLVENEWRDFTEAYAVAEETEKIIPDDPELEALFAKISLPMSVHTTPPGASVYVKNYSAPESPWRLLGTSPLDSVRMPVGIFRWRLALAGYDTVTAVASSWALGLPSTLLVPYTLERSLTPAGSTPEGMVRVEGIDTPSGSIPGFLIDRYEVTNREYKKFVDAGGYRERRYWKHEFVIDGTRLAWEEAMALMVDETSRPGPASWQAGDYRDGQAEYPVSGISWYEAAAYAEFVGKELPTSTHWGLARGERTPVIDVPQLGGVAVFAPFSNIGRKGPLPVDSLPGVTVYGASDMAGNVREWCWNRSKDGRIIRGGAWGDNSYMFNQPSQSPAFDRSLKNGFRCALYPDRDRIPGALFESVDFGDRPDFRAMKPVSDEVFAVYRDMFSYDPAPLNTEMEYRREENPEWIHERVSFDAAYRGERVIGHLFLPRNASPPYQTVVYFPGSATAYETSSDDIEDYYEFPIFLSFLVKNGRAVFFPVYTGTFERQRADLNEIDAAYKGIKRRSRLYTEYTVELVKDFRRSVDYLASRDDIDAGKLAFYGMSWGGILGAIIPALEPRLETSVIASGGFTDIGRPEAHQTNYAGRIRMPVLMLNGRYDSIFPLETSIQPMFDMIGTPPEDKALKLFDSDHIVPKTDYIREILDWLDRYLGPTR